MQGQARPVQEEPAAAGTAMGTSTSPGEQGSPSGGQGLMEARGGGAQEAPAEVSASITLQPATSSIYPLQ